jgi:hypothetical protein
MTTVQILDIEEIFPAILRTGLKLGSKTCLGPADIGKQKGHSYANQA